MKLVAVLCVSAVQALAVEPWILSTANDRQHLVTPEGKPFLMLGYFKCQLVDAVLPTGMLKQGLLESRAGSARDSFAASLRDIHQRVLKSTRPLDGK